MVNNLLKVDEKKASIKNICKIECKNLMIRLYNKLINTSNNSNCQCLIFVNEACFKALAITANFINQ